MCVRFHLLKRTAPSSLGASFVPCGKCEECRDSQKSQWTFRLRSELDYCKSKGWHIGFFTLTYNDAHLPHIPRVLFEDEAQYRPLSCFSRYDVRTFIDNIRKRVNERFKVKSLRYMVCSEYGSSERTRRPHYHGIICFPPEVSPVDMFDLIRSNWTDKGHVFPRYITGGVDSHGYDHKPFLLDGDTEGAAKYAAKYCCKDLNWYESISEVSLRDEDKEFKELFRRCKPFHLQSRGIGSSWLCGKSTDELIKLFRHGDSFLGQLKTKALPLYIRNKVLFNNVYSFEEYMPDCGDTRCHDWSFDYETGKFKYTPNCGTHVRLCRRETTEFFDKYYREIYQQKKEYYAELFHEMSDYRFWSNRGAPLPAALKIVSVFRHTTLSDSDLADYFLGRFGIDKKQWLNVDAPTSWYARYHDIGFAGLEDFTSEQLETMSQCDDMCKYLLDRFQWVYKYDKESRDRVKAVKDFYSHQT